MEAIAIRLVNRRAQEVNSATRLDILASNGAACLLIAVISWQFASPGHRLPQIGLAAVILYAVATVYRFRLLIWPAPTPPSVLAATGVAHYRAVLQRRRDHLTKAWIWHGPLILALLIVIAELFQLAVPGKAPLRNMLPFLSLLVLWIFLAVFLFRRKLVELQRELNELDSPQPTGNFT